MRYLTGAEQRRARVGIRDKRTSLLLRASKLPLEVAARSAIVNSCRRCSKALSERSGWFIHSRLVVEDFFLRREDVNGRDRENASVSAVAEGVGLVGLK